MIGIYKLTSPSGKIYIGQSTNIKRRLKDYEKLRCKKQQALYNSLVKYGYKNFIIEILEECTSEQLNELEEYYIKINNSMTPKGYNLTSGGLCCEYTKEAKNNCKRGYMKKEYSKIIDTYYEPILLFDKDLNFIIRYNNLEDACVENGLKANDVYYNSFLLMRSDKFWILENCKNIKYTFHNVIESLYDIYKFELDINKIDKYLT